MLLKEQDLLIHKSLGNGKVVEVVVEKCMFSVEFENDGSVRRFDFSNLEAFFKKYFPKDDTYKIYDQNTGSWFNLDGFDDEGYDREGYDREGYSKKGFNRESFHIRTGGRFGPDGYNVKGYNKQGYDKNGVHYITKNPFVLYKMVIDEIKEDINRDIYIKSLIKVGKETTDQFIKEKLREEFKKLNSGFKYWERIKRRLVEKLSWNSFSLYERSDIPPPEIPDKKRQAYCYKCRGSLYSDIHQKCKICGWLICPYDNACGCGYGFDLEREDFRMY